MKFPKHIKHRGRVLTTIYEPKRYPLYRVAWNAAGKRMMKSFPRYGEAKRHAEQPNQLFSTLQKNLDYSSLINV